MECQTGLEEPRLAFRYRRHSTFFLPVLMIAIYMEVRNCVRHTGSQLLLIDRKFSLRVVPLRQNHTCPDSQDIAVCLYVPTGRYEGGKLTQRFTEV
jgi:hypothetical protein